MHAGVATLAAGLAGAVLAYRSVPLGTYPVALPYALVVAGLGTGPFTTPFFTTALSGVGAQETGWAAGLLNAVQQLGGTFGVAVVGGVYLAADGTPSGAAQAAVGTAGTVLAATAVAAATMTARPRNRGHGRDRA
ncbi:hypothetical protein [Streptomyces sp. NPDC002769]|uniref:hypothetical protein n=1 Tax=Streptomyces sp. NPDC002769 TaxID=3154542 RepID=UPI003316AD2F